jgi:ATP-dependent Clp protease adaptor protein ClpS
VALSNPAGLINLRQIVGPGIDPVAGHLAGICVLAAGRTPTHIPAIDPVHGSGRPGAAIWKRAWELMAPEGEHRPVAMRFPVGISNTCAMLQLTSQFASLVPPAAASAVVMGSDENRSGGAGGPATSVIAKVKPKTKRPNLYRVLILNDDYTPMEFVVHVLEKFFQKDVEAATKIMLHVHHHGIGECGVFTYEIAETKVTQVMDFARKHQHPLQCVMEKK